MPTVKKCPVCNTNMQRLYRREHLGGPSRYYGIVWLCNDLHVLISDKNGEYTLAKA